MPPVKVEVPEPLTEIRLEKVGSVSKTRLPEPVSPEMKAANSDDVSMLLLDTLLLKVTKSEAPRYPAWAWVAC